MNTTIKVLADDNLNTAGVVELEAVGTKLHMLVNTATLVRMPYRHVVELHAALGAYLQVIQAPRTPGKP